MLIKSVRHAEKLMSSIKRKIQLFHYRFFPVCMILLIRGKYDTVSESR